MSSKNVAEFLQYLWEKLPILNDVITVRKTITTLCEICNITRAIDSNDYHICKLFVPINKFEHTIQSIIDDNYLPSGNQLFCENCQNLKIRYS